ncbi:coat protein [Plumeria mosaic virus]|uniref:Capsid protein n=1 Tax=Plumeria mosaic virus TaxID=1501716 RepID=A0A0E3DDZ9_9VIRU|nr:coat protein [Plumeria mosaic virus]AIA57393.1 coat protein [Plumeria mosaic virus]APD13855.1 coat protein [Plumeria mosaic virus]
MAYTNISTVNLQYFSRSYIPGVEFINLIISGLGQSFQTQSARDEFRAQLIGSYKVVVTSTVRFPENSIYLWANNPAIRPLLLAVFQALDTRNRIIEVESANAINPTSSETREATRRVDDATVAVRSQLQLLFDALSGGTGLYDRKSFEEASGLVWEEAAATGTAGTSGAGTSTTV